MHPARKARTSTQTRPKAHGPKYAKRERRSRSRGATQSASTTRKTKAPPSGGPFRSLSSLWRRGWALRLLVPRPSARKRLVGGRRVGYLAERWVVATLTKPLLLAGVLLGLLAFGAPAVVGGSAPDLRGAFD